jgi:UDP-3-O-[3-hydroxymyristoyl] glucosamine N-acyltransferase
LQKLAPPLGTRLHILGANVPENLGPASQSLNVVKDHYGISTSSSEAQSRPKASAQLTTNAVPPAKPHTEVHPTAHLDPQAYIQGRYTITLGANVVIHPRVRLVSVYGPLTIGAGTVISERCIVGGPGPDPREPLPPEPAEPFKTVIGQNVMLHASAEIEAGASLDDASLIEPRAVVKKGVNIGKHSKVCAGCLVDRSVGNWVVIWGDGQISRTRAGAEQPENGRLKALEREREAVSALLKAAAAKAMLGKRRG